MIPKRPAITLLPKISDIRGNLSFIEQDKHIPFDIQRVYYIYGVPQGESRGEHAHKKLQQFFLCLHGSFHIDLDDGLSYFQSFHLHSPSQGLFIPQGYWRNLHSFSADSVCMVLASLPYDERDYIRDYREFKQFKKELLHSCCPSLI